ncbi:tRNA lysidine(34) synthetase TilS [Noviherbaspirillum sedimenti]|uniref:tRNA(Ile)-lysidine synthase n=1 Tax=Noviherbaspirillum sedimenti TaxID=2320865 RepID=A0A3A3G1Z8_9BURK|nr:tRNA lysidine(34) synthetase TilS [Noviherbaspirillum sedimenti]RJG00502.1 tRNA lysidine(34) synthetase TilS [Noviherbaspirillum sedimenti]
MGRLSTLSDRFERALEAILARVSVCAGLPVAPAAVAVAYSGGLDSSVLLRLAQQQAAVRGVKLFAFHVHHGLSPNADAWLAHCEREAGQLGVAFAAQRVQIGDTDRSGVEEAARVLRYAALGALCRKHGVALLLTAHHLDDQAETVLLQLLRGSGVAGLSGMDDINAAPDLLGDARLLMARPLLDISRAELEAWAARAGIAHVEDESNADVRYARNALRQGVMPQLSQSFPGFQERLARSASHMQAAQRLLLQLAQDDLAACADGACLDLERLRGLSSERLDNLLRHWLGVHGVRMPSTAWLTEMRAQMLDAKADAQLCVSHPDCAIRRYRNRVYLTPKWDEDAASVAPQPFRWQGEASLDFSAYQGRLHFESAAEGLDAAWLRAQPLLIRYRQGGENVKLAANRPTRSLKQHFQALHVPAWERPFLPLVTAGQEVLYAAGIGMDCHRSGSGQGEYVRLRWEHVLQS